ESLARVLEEQLAAELRRVELEIPCSRIEVGVAEQRLYVPQARPRLEKVRRERAPERVGRDPLSDPGGPRELNHNAIDRALLESLPVAREEDGRPRVHVQARENRPGALEVIKDPR